MLFMMKAIKIIIFIWFNKELSKYVNISNIGWKMDRSQKIKKHL
jgi:hypothetical protein